MKTFAQAVEESGQTFHRVTLSEDQYNTLTKEAFNAGVEACRAKVLEIAQQTHGRTSGLFAVRLFLEKLLK